MNRDLTVGKPERVLWEFCLPLFGSIIFQQLYNIADSLVAGKFIGENALAAVGNSYEITLIFIAFAFGCNMGCSVIVSHLFGEKRYGDMKTAVHTAMISSGVLVASLVVFGVVGRSFLLRLIQTPADIFEDSRLYLDIYVLGLPFLFFYNISTGIFSALGDSRTPFWFLAISSVSNIAVDILFVKGFHMGVAGVAWATFLCQGISCILSVIVVFRRLAAIRTKEPVYLYSWPLFRRICGIAIPSVLQQSSISIGNIILQGVINGFGPGVIAGYSASVKLNNMVISAFTTLGNGISNYTAQNLGAGKLIRIREGFRAGAKIVWILSLPLALLYFFGGGAIIRFFIDQPSEDALNTGIIFLRILSPFYFVISVKLVFDGILRGAGQMMRFMIATFSDLLVRVVFAIVFARFFGSVGLWCAWPFGWATGFFLTWYFYRQGPWCRNKGGDDSSLEGSENSERVTGL